VGERLLASGRDADIYEHGPGLVRRRTRSGRSMADEARTMTWAREHGYPVPAVESISADGLDLVMERIEGTTMVDLLARQPWAIARHGRSLADLHRRLHDVPAPGWLPPAPCGTPGDRLLHLDLHPLNVMVTASGPVVIDWANAHAGHPDVDVALTWALVAAGRLDGNAALRAMAKVGRGVLLRAFLAGVDADGARAQLPAVVGWKAGDANLGPDEVAVMRALAGSRPRRSGARPGRGAS
jgi:aminoglycoside phosphotransferase (APT) family kinase protein